MITNEGKLQIKRFLAGMTPAIGRSIAFGAGSKAEEETDTRLQFETARANVTLISYDFDTNKLVFKAVLDAGFTGVIYEAGLFSNDNTVNASRMISSFEYGTENWTNANFVTGAQRIGSDGLSMTPAASGSTTASLTNLGMDFSNDSAADLFNFAFINGNANLSSLRFRFMTDANNYYDFTIASPETGYNIVTRAMSSATVTGAPRWGSINEIQVTANAGAGGAVALTLDGIRLEDVDTLNPDAVMVSRELLAAPLVKEAGLVQEVEFTMNVSV